MTPAEFISKWSDATLRERQGSQEHFLDLCRLLGQPTPAEDDPHGERYCFERGATKAGGGDGWADVWRRGCFGWEYKGPHKDLNAAFRQLSIYASALENPPYLVVSDMARIPHELDQHRQPDPRTLARGPPRTGEAGPAPPGLRGLR